MGSKPLFSRKIYLYHHFRVLPLRASTILLLGIPVGDNTAVERTLILACCRISELKVRFKSADCFALVEMFLCRGFNNEIIELRRIRTLT